MAELVFDVEAEVLDAAGGSDAAYHLCGAMTAAELAAELAAWLGRPVADSLHPGPGDRLVVTVRDRGAPAPITTGATRWGVRWARAGEWQVTSYPEGGYSVQQNVDGFGWVVADDMPADVVRRLCAALGIESAD